MLQLLIDTLNGQAHHVIVAAVKPRAADVAYPLLNAVGASFVEGSVTADVETDFLVAKLLERHLGGHAESALLLARGQTNARCDVVDASGAACAAHRPCRLACPSPHRRR